MVRVQSARGLDHIVHAVGDLDAAADIYRSLGFTVGARNKHPWGTHNYIVQCPGFFIELLTLAEPDKLGSDGISTLFAAYTRDYVARHDGLALLILESRDAEADVAAYRAAGIGIGDTMHFERAGQRPDGSEVKVGFSLAFAQDTRTPDIHYATCQQHFPENFWNPQFQKHANGVTAIAGIALVADRPAEHRDFLLRYTGAAQAVDYIDGLRIHLPRGTIDVVSPMAFTQQYGLAAPLTANGARLAAVRLAVPDTAVVISRLIEAGIRPAAGGTLPVSDQDATVLNPDSAAVCVPVMGAALVFERAS